MGWCVATTVTPSAGPAAPQVATVLSVPQPPHAPLDISGIKKAAIVLTSLNGEECAAILRQLPEEDVQDVIREITLLGQVTPEERNRVLAEFIEMHEGPEVFRNHGIEYATSVLVAAFGPETGKRMAERLTKSLGTPTPGIDSLRKIDPQHLAKAIHSEHPQAIALILCHLGTSQAAHVLSALPEDLRSEVTMRMASIDQISPDVVSRISRTIGNKLRILEDSSLETYRGVRAVAEVMNRLETATSETILGYIEADDPTLAQAIRNLMFVFEDFLKVPQDAVRTIVSKIDRKVLVMALKGSDPAVRKLFASVLSTRSAEMLQEDMDALGPVRIRDVDEARQKIISEARKLHTEGVINLQASAAEQYVV